MYNFDGDYRQKPKQSLRGASKKEEREALLQRASQERQKREEIRKQTAGAIKIQSFIRSAWARNKQKCICRHLFDNLQLQSFKEPIHHPSQVTHLLRLIIFFYDSNLDTQRLLWLCQQLLKLQQEMIRWILQGDNVWEFHIKKLLDCCLRYLSVITDGNSPVAIPLRMLEVFTAVDFYVPNGHPHYLDKTVQILTKIFFFLLRKGYMKHLRKLVDTKIPFSLETSIAPPTPISGTIFELLMRPLSLITLNSCKEEYRQLTICQLCLEFFNSPFSEQISSFILPAMVYGKYNFPFSELILALASVCRSVYKTSEEVVTHEVFVIRPSLWLLRAYLTLAEPNLEKLNDETQGNYLLVLDHLSTSLHIEVKTETDLYSDNDQDMDLQYNDIDLNSNESVIQQEAIKLINKPKHVQCLINILDKRNDSSALNCLCRICYIFLMRNKLAVHKNRLLYTLAFKPSFLQHLWLNIKAISTTTLLGSQVSLLQMLAQGLQMPDDAVNRIVPPLALFCSLFGHLLIILHDAEFYGGPEGSASMPFTLDELIPMSLMLRDVSLGLIELAYANTRHTVRENYRQAIESVSSIRNSFSIKETEIQTQKLIHLFNVIVQLVKSLYSRDTRQRFCPHNHWLSNNVSIHVDGTMQIYKGRNATRSFSPFIGFRLLNIEQFEDEIPPMTITEIRSVIILRELPFVVPFHERVVILQRLILKDKEENQGSMTNFLTGPSIHILVRRNFIYEDAFDKLSYDNEPNLKLKMRVQLINAVGLDEAGIDGGGVFREFLSELLKTGFDPNRGFFRTTHDRLLYPNPQVHLFVEDFTKHFYFLGRMLGKALYENMLVELPFAEFFLSKLLSRNSSDVDIHHLASLDPVMYKNLLYLKNYDGDVSDLGLDFTVMNNELGEAQLEELKSNGRNIAVTVHNRIEYIHLVADYKLNKQMRIHCNAFRQGLANVVNLDWLQMFDYRELQVLISGAQIPISVEDLKLNTNYSGGYSPDHPVIKYFWKVVESFDDRQKRQLLKFVTSCSRPPLLGFKELYPAFCIQNAGNEADRLPTASTCMNLLKLPEFQDEKTLRSKLIYAIESGAGFELS